jgi:hypothetical protein
MMCDSSSSVLNDLSNFAYQVDSFLKNDCVASENIEEFAKSENICFRVCEVVLKEDNAIESLSVLCNKNVYET